MKKIKQIHPDANIVAIDYDPSATKVNQDNRIKLMLAIAREKIKEGEKAKL
jgi:predicted nucleotide-binding protein (sugar kinase/HSP70/actin superfamily)